MEEVTNKGKTVLFVSHNLEAIKNLCGQCIVLEKGGLIYYSDVNKGLYKYNNIIESTINQNTDLTGIARDKWKNEIQFEIIDFNSNKIDFADPILIKVKVKNNAYPASYENVEFAFSIRNTTGLVVIHGSTKFIDSNFTIDSDIKWINIEVPNNLRPGKYYITIFLREKGNIQDWLTDVASFEILDGSPYGWSNLSEIQGLTFPDYKINV